MLPGPAGPVRDRQRRLVRRRARQGPAQVGLAAQRAQRLHLRGHRRGAGRGRLPGGADPVRRARLHRACASPAGSTDPFRRHGRLRGDRSGWSARPSINIGGVVGLLPITGLPLPFISDGGSALVVTLAVVGMLASFARAEPDAAAALHARPAGRSGSGYSGRRCRRCPRARGRPASATTRRRGTGRSARRDA